MVKLSTPVTRGLVVSTRDPLFSGRVKVWIPTLHGEPRREDTGVPSGDGDSKNTDFSAADGLISLQAVSQGNSTQATWENEDSLPWAYVLGNNWGPVGNILTGEPLYTANKPNGVMCIPKIGTEVFIIFEDDNPNQPIVIGAVFHENELLAMSSTSNLEISPGVFVNTSSQLDKTEGSYDSSVSESYVIRSLKGSTLIISDIPDKEQIILGGSVPSTESAGNFINNAGGAYNEYANAYPNFPTTSSAPYAVRELIGKAPNIPQIIVSTPTGTTGATGSTGISGVSGVSTVASSPVLAVPKPAEFKCYPLIAFNSPLQKDQLFLASRPGGRQHLGVDLGTSGVVGRPLLAPAKGQVLVIGGSDIDTGGIWMIFKDAYGFAHRFLHLQEIGEVIKTNLAKNTYPVYDMGTELGKCGKSGRSSSGTIYQAHLHWEVIPLNDGTSSYANKITSSNAASLFEYAQQTPNGGTISGTTIHVGTYSFKDPIKNWIVADIGANLLLSGDQTLSTVTAMNQDAADSKWDKLIGLEVCMTPGKEHIYLRHTSGSYFGFDADGNFKLFTVGDAHVRVNRSVTMDIFGAITTGAMSIFTKVTSIIRTHAGAFKSAHNGNKFNPINPDNTSNIKDSNTYALFPEELYNIDLTRLSDMANAVQASTSNFYVTSALDGSSKSIENIVKDDSRITLLSSERVEKDFTNNTYDSDIQTFFTMYLGPQVTQDDSASVVAVRGSQYFKWQLFKAQMLQESNGQENARNSSGAYGLFQLTEAAVRDAKGKVKDAKRQDTNVWMYDYLGTGMEPYKVSKLNIETAILYYRKCLDNIYQTIKIVRYAKGMSMTDLTSREKDAIVKMALVSYTAGYSTVITLLKSVLDTDSGLISYVSLEEKMILNKFPRAQLTYVPVITTWILPKV